MEINMNRVFRDIETGEAVTMWQLKKEYDEHEPVEGGYEYDETFPEYVTNCQTFRGGTLEEIRDYAVRREFVRYVVLKNGAWNYDGIVERDWRELATFDTAEAAAHYITGLI